METAETRHYPNPPIIEAVIQMVFETTLKESEVVKCSESYARSYPGAQEFRLVKFAEVKPGATVNLKHGDGVQFRRATDDQQEVLIVTNEFIAIAALAPYKGWSNRLVAKVCGLFPPLFRGAGPLCRAFQNGMNPASMFTSPAMIDVLV